MKLLLTSSGIKNESIEKAFESLLGKPFSQSKVLIIPTASLIQAGNHGWFMDEITTLYNLGWQEFDIMELNGTPKPLIAARINNADAIYASGGNLYYLCSSIVRNGLTETFKKALDEKVYVGSSAGSMIFSKNVNPHSAKVFSETDEAEIGQTASPFNLFDWYLKPHLNSKDFPERDEDWAMKTSSDLHFPIYFIDDQTALKVVDDKVEVITEGAWKLFND